MYGVESRQQKTRKGREYKSHFLTSPLDGHPGVYDVGCVGEGVEVDFTSSLKVYVSVSVLVFILFLSFDIMDQGFLQLRKEFWGLKVFLKGQETVINRKWGQYGRR